MLLLQVNAPVHKHHAMQDESKAPHVFNLVTGSEMSASYSSHFTGGGIVLVPCRDPNPICPTQSQFTD